MEEDCDVYAFFTMNVPIIKMVYHLLYFKVCIPDKQPIDYITIND